jgi:GNAT superfamily N-acetyltransferase
MGIEIRPATLEQAVLISKLAASIDSTGGPFGIRMCLHKDAYSVFLRHPQSKCLVALTKEGRLVGYHFRRPVNVLINDALVLGSLGFNLAVKPEFRRQGIGSMIYKAVHKDCIDNGISVFFGNTEIRNAAQRGNVKKAGMIEVRNQIRAMVATRSSRPRLPPGVSIGRIEDADLASWAEAANAFYRDHDFWQPISVDLLRSWLSPRCDGCKHVLYAAKDPDGKMLAGLGLDDCSQLFTWVVNGLPNPIPMIGRLMNITDAKGHIPFAKAVLLWFGEGKADVARCLWEWIRWDLRKDVRLIVIYYDPLSPVSQAIRSSVYLPKTENVRVARLFSDIKISGSRPIGTEFI